MTELQKLELKIRSIIEVINEYVRYDYETGLDVNARDYLLAVCNEFDDIVDTLVGVGFDVCYTKEKDGTISSFLARNSEIVIEPYSV